MDEVNKEVEIKVMKTNMNILKIQGWHDIIKILVIAGVIFSAVIGYPGFTKGEEIKCQNYCCTKIIKAIGVVIKHEGREDEKILHSRTCDLLDNYDSHDYQFCAKLESAWRKGFVKCEICNLKVIEHDPCTAKCCKYYGWIIEPMGGALHRKDCHILGLVKMMMYPYLEFICSRHNTEEELVDEALVKRKAVYRVCNSCLRDVITKRYKLPKGELMSYKSGKVK